MLFSGWGRGWFWKNNGPRPPIDPHTLLILMLFAFDLYYWSKFFFVVIVGSFVQAVQEWAHPTGRFFW